MGVLSIVDVLVIGLASFWLWFVVARLSPPFLMFALRPLRRRPAIRHFLACPWCAGFWWSLAVTLALALFIVLVVGTHSWIEALVWTPFTALGSAAIVGVAGTLLPDDGEPLDD